MKIFLVILFSIIALSNQAQNKVFTRIPLSFQLLTDSLDPNTPIHVYLKGDEAIIRNELIEMGGHFKRIVGNYIAAIVPASMIVKMDTMQCFDAIHFELGKGLPLLDQSLISTKVIDVHEGRGLIGGSYTGDGVLLGIIDAGLDINHPDFKYGNGNTRVVEYWDQTMAFNAQRTPSYGYGQVWDSADINASICPVVDQAIYFGHGTNTTGIAAGNGLSNDDYTGVAKNSELIIVSSNFNSLSWTSTVADAVDYIFSKAEEMNRPCVINISLGNYGGSHDGRDIATQEIEQLLDEAPGRALVCAAGNSGNSAPYHLGYEASTDTNFTWFQTAANSSAGSAFIFFEVYGDVGDFENLQFSVGADKVSPYYHFAGQVDFDSVLNRLYINFQEDLISENGNYLAQVQTWADTIGGTYRLQVYLSEIDSIFYKYRFSVTGSGRFDLWSGPLTETATMVIDNLPNATQFPDIVRYKSPDMSQTIVSNWACSPKVITVGNQINRTSYVNYDNQTTTVSGIVAGSIAASSSVGPNRLGNQKPDITAPGDFTLTAGAAYQISALLANTNLRDRVAPGGFHHRAGGTSSASPVVAGIAALFFEHCPNASWAEFKQAIIEGSFSDGFTGTVPNDQWGFGKVDALQTLAYLTPKATVLTASTEFCDGDSVILSLSDNYPTMEWVSGQNTQAIVVKQSGYYFAELQNEYGCIGFSDSLAVFKRPVPQKPSINRTGNEPACIFETILLSVPQSYGAYHWSTGEHTQSIDITNPGFYSCTVSNIYNCQNVSDSIGVSFYPSIDEPLLTLKMGDTLQLTHDTLGVFDYQWFKNGELILGANSDFYALIQTGNYRGSIIDSNGCHWFSNEVNVVALSTASIGKRKVIVFPTLFENEITILTPLSGKWVLMNSLSQVVKQGEIGSGENQIATVGLNSGCYFLVTQIGETNETFKLIHP